MGLPDVPRVFVKTPNHLPFTDRHDLAIGERRPSLASEGDAAQLRVSHSRRSTERSGDATRRRRRVRSRRQIATEPQIGRPVDTVEVAVVRE